MRLRNAIFAIAVAAVAWSATPASAVELWNGYLRTGIGGNGDGGNQVCFLTAPLGYKFRLGNECETYWELGLSQTLYRDKSGLTFDFYSMVHFKTGGYRNAEPLNGQGNEFQLRQLWVNVKGIPGLGDANVWLGNRYYRRSDLHMLDLFYWDNSAPGIGIENVDLGGFAKLAVGVMQNKSGWGLGYDVTPNLMFWRPDIRIYGIPVGIGTLEFGAIFNIASGAAYDNSQRFSPWLTLQHEWQGVLGGMNKLAFQWATGTIAPMTPYPEPQNGGDARRWRIVEHLMVQPIPQFSGSFAFVYEDVTSQYGGSGSFNSFKSWSLGLRPIWHITDIFRLNLEWGIQSFIPKDPPTDTAVLNKITLAPGLTPPPGPGGGYYMRPELRIFMTYAWWNDAQNAQFQTWNGVYYTNGGPPAVFGTANGGFTYGAQVELWF
jgi:maltoporin